MGAAVGAEDERRHKGILELAGGTGGSDVSVVGLGHEAIDGD